jgi:indolepyruvate ferredoxin oxidoreductase
MDIRGYGPVKEAAIHQVQSHVERLWERLAADPVAIDRRAPEQLRA